MTGERILVVEDNALNMKLFRDALVATGYRTLEATTGSEAVDMASEHTPDLVLMDIQLPDLDGLSVTRHAKSHAQTRSIPILAVSAYAMRGDADRAREAGCDGYVTKPIDTRELPVIVAKYLEQAAAARETGAKE